MKFIIWNFIKIFFIIVIIEILLFILMIFFIMTDESIGIIGKLLVKFVKYVLGFPLILFNNDYPFFMDRNTPPNYMILLIILNLVIQTSIVFLIKNFIKGKINW